MGKGPGNIFPKDTNGQQVYKKVLNIINQGMQIKTTMRYHLTPNIRKIREKCWRWVEKKEPMYTTGGNVNWYSHYGKQYGVSQKIKNGATTWSSNPTSGYIPEGNEISISKRYLHFHIHCRVTHNSQYMEIT